MTAKFGARGIPYIGILAERKSPKARSHVFTFESWYLSHHAVPGSMEVIELIQLRALRLGLMTILTLHDGIVLLGKRPLNEYNQVCQWCGCAISGDIC